MVRYAKPQLPVDIHSIQSEVSAITQPWSPHFNTKHYEGGWTVISLRAPGGHADRVIPDLVQEGGYMDTPLMENCPAIRELVAAFKCPVLSVRLMNLQAGAIIKEHRDHELAFEKGEARLHFPIFTNDGVEFYVDNERIPMREGDCWYINANLPHRVANHGSTDRIHLVIDCKVNAWVEELFVNAEKKYVPNDQQHAQLLQVIRELRSQGNETADKLANELEGRLP
jgi:mannose-6-phosphate isomerase-like protein (cupin superfamily)